MEMKLVSLEQRRHVQVLILLYSRSKVPACIRKPARVLRGNAKFKFRLISRCSENYLNSPLYRGSISWNNIPSDVQHSMNYWCSCKARCSNEQ